MSETIIITIIGVLGTIAGTVIGMISNGIAEKKRAKNDGRIHVSKMQFDLQIEIYRKLSSAFFRVLVKFNTLESITTGKDIIHGEKLSPDDYKSLIEATCNAQDLLYENAPFIPEDIYKKYDDLNNIINNQFWAYMNISPEASQNSDKTDELKNAGGIAKYIEYLLREINALIRSQIAEMSIIE